MIGASQQIISTIDLTKSRKHNHLSEDKWVFVSRKDDQVFYFDFCPEKLGLHPKSVFWLKLAIRHEFKSLSDGSILLNESELSKFLIFNQKLLTYAEQHHPDMRLNEWAQWDIDKFIMALLFSKSDSATRTIKAAGSKLISKKVFDRYLLEIDRNHKRFTKGMMDGFQFPVHRNRVFSDAQKLILETNDDYADWLDGGTWGRVPLEVAMLLLQHCISIIRSPETILLLTMYEVSRECENAPYPASMANVLSDHLSFRVKNGAFKHELQPHFRINIHINHPKLLSALDMKLKEFSSEGVELKDWPFLSQGEYVSHFKRVYTASFVIFLTITGARWSELIQLSANSIVKEPDGKYVFISGIEKTNHGIETVRDITGLAAEATDILLAMSTSDKVKGGDSLFTGQMVFSNKEFEPRTWSLVGSHTTTKNNLNSLFSEFLSAYPLFEEIHSNISPHQFRHSFAEFALRRFDGNVIAAIRDHFRHSIGSYMTRRYTDRKVIEKDFPVNLNREYIGEIIMRYIEDKEVLHGPVGKFIRQRINEIDIASPQDVQDLIDEFEDDLVVHEYGICLIRHKTKALSKCWNPKTATPETTNSNFRLCSGCANRLTLDCQKENIERLGFSAQGHLDFFEKSGIPMNPSYKAAILGTIKNAASALNDWKKPDDK